MTIRVWRKQGQKYGVRSCFHPEKGAWREGREGRGGDRNSGELRVQSSWPLLALQASCACMWGSCMWGEPIVLELPDARGAAASHTLEPSTWWNLTSNLA